MIQVRRIDEKDSLVSQWAIEVDGKAIKPYIPNLRRAAYVANWLTESGLKVCDPNCTCIPHAPPKEVDRDQPVPEDFPSAHELPGDEE